MIKCSSTRRAQRTTRSAIETLEGRRLLAATVYQAESAVLAGGTTAQSDYAGYTGTGFANLPTANGSVTWNANASAAGEHTLAFRYALLGGPRNVALSVNGVTLAGGITFTDTGSWANWGTLAKGVQLNAGANTIRVASIGQDGGNIDSLTVTDVAAPTPPPVGVVYQAEGAARAGGTTIDSNNAGYTGSGFANLPTGGGSVTWTVNAGAAEAHKLAFRYALLSGSRNVQLTVNGAVVPGGLTFTSTGSWATWSNLSTTVQLKAGSNTIRVASTGQDAGNIDYLAVARAVDGTVSFSGTLTTNAYATGGINSVSVSTNNLVTAKSGHQFIAYYDANRTIIIGRRASGAAAWQTFDTGIALSTGEAADDHNVVAVAIDGNGFLHMSWNMHNVALNYATSNAPVTGATLSSIALTKRTAANAPSLFPAGGATTNEVTYPQFYPIPNGNNLLFTYRNGGAGGGSGNGNQYLNVYDAATKTWTNRLLIDGQRTGVNGYLNNLVYDSKGNLLMSWTWRESPAWQSNSNIMFAQSPDNGVTWFRRGGTPQYAMPIIQNTSNGGSAAQVGEVIKSIPQGSSYINQTSMTVDRNDNPIIATYYAPGWNPATNSGNPNRQYMVVYFTGTQWKTTQVSQRTSDTSIDTSAYAVRDLGRPIVLVDKQGRVLVVTRSQDTAMGAYKNPSTPNNKIVVYYSSNFTSGTPTWNAVTLDGANMGAWEPSYDPALWKSQNKLNLFYEPLGLTGQSTAAVKVLQWDEQLFFGAA